MSLDKHNVKLSLTITQRSDFDCRDLESQSQLKVNNQESVSMSCVCETRQQLLYISIHHLYLLATLLLTFQLFVLCMISFPRLSKAVWG